MGVAPEEPKKKEDKKEKPKKDPKDKEQKPCRSDQIRNPETGKCVLKTGAIGKKILAGMGGAPEEPKDKKKDKFEIKKTLADGNCFYSAIYRSLKYKNLLEDLCNCLSINCENEKDFINNFRNKLSNSNDLKQQYLNFFNYIINNLNSKTFKETLKILLKDMGDVRDVVKIFIKNNKFKIGNFDEFFLEIQKSIRKNYSYVGQFEVHESLNILLNCGIDSEIFTNKKNAINFVKNMSDDDYNKILVLVLNQRGEHWEYI